MQLRLLQLTTIQTQQGQKEEGECYHTQMLVLRQDRPHPNGMQKKKINEQTSDLEEERNQVKIPQQQNIHITDLEDLDEIKEYTQKIEEEARLMELP